MPLELPSDSPPVREDESGALRIGDSRVLLDLVIRAFQDGATPEAIVQRYATLTLQDVYAVIAYYLRHQREVDEYLARRERDADRIQDSVERQQGDLSDTRKRRRSHRKAG